MTVLILGGSKSGKSDYAQQVALTLAKGGVHYYVATMQPGDKEDHARIRSHLQRRAGMEFETVECPRNILSVFSRADPHATFLVDSITALLTSELFPPETGYMADEAAAARCREELLCFAGKAANTVFVCDDLFRDAGRYDPATDAFRRHLGGICCALAAHCDVVLEANSGIITVYKGEKPV